MKHIQPNNPFLIAGYFTPEYFCDREQETVKITTALHNERNLTLIAPRRMGKTGLIKHVFYKLREQQKEIVTLYLDIYSTQNLNEFVQLFANTVLGSLDIAPTREEATLKEIFDYLKSSEKRCYIAIDEFQQIAEYPEKGVEALLRSYIQFLPNVHFIFAGSRQHVMQEMFLSAKRPFYQSTQTISLDRIEQEAYFDFASSFFAGQKRQLTGEVFEQIYNEFEGHTWYIQVVLNRLFSYTGEIVPERINEALSEIIAENEYSYQNLLTAYATGAVRLMKAIAKEGTVTEINASSFIAKYRLKASSSVNTALRTLLKKEMVYKSERGYMIYDRFLAIWLRRQAY